MPSKYTIAEQKDQINSQMLTEARVKLLNLQTRLAKIENQRVKGVNLTLEANDIKKRIVKAHSLIKKLSNRDMLGFLST